MAKLMRKRRMTRCDPSALCCHHGHGKSPDPLICGRPPRPPMGDALAKSGLWQAERSNVIPPALCLDHSRAYCAAMKPAYRLFDVPRAAEHGVPADHFAANAARLAATDGPILIFQDEADFPVTARDPARSASPTPSVMGATGRAFFGPNGRKDPANPEPSPVQQAALLTPAIA